MAFTDEESVMEIFEGLMKDLFHAILGHEIITPIPRLEYQTAMDRFGTDRPDTRFGMELHDISDLVSDTAFKVFRSAIEKGGKVTALWNYDPEDLDLEEDIEDLKIISKLDLKLNPEGGETRFKRMSQEY